MRVRALFKKLMLILLGLLLALVLLVGTLLWWVVYRPESAWNFAKRHFFPADLQVTWQEIHFKPEKITWLHWNIDWRVVGLKIQKAEPLITAPIDEVGLVFSFSVYEPATRADFASVTVRATQPIVFQPEAPRPEDPPVKLSPYQRARQIVHYLETGNSYFSMRNLDVTVKNFQFIPAVAVNEPLLGSFSVLKSEKSDSPNSIQLKLQVQSKKIQKAEFTGQLDLARVASSTEPFATGALNFEGYGASGRTALSLIFAGETLRGKAKGPWSYRAEKNVFRFEPEVDLKLDEGQGELRLITAAADLPEPLLKLDRIDVHLIVPFENGAEWSGQPATFRVNGPVSLFFIDKDMRPPLEKSCECKIPEKLLVDYSGKIWLRPLTAFKAPTHAQPVAETRLGIEGVKNKLLSVDIAAGLNILRSPTNQWEYRPQLNSEIHVLSYKGLRNFLDARNVIIPSPFDVLEGTIDIIAKGDVVTEKGLSRIPIVTNFKLASEHQIVKLEADTRVDMDATLRNIDVYLRLLIEDFQVQLPPLDPIAGMPKFVRDSRVQMTPPPAASAKAKVGRAPIKVNVFVEAKTLHPGAIRLLSKYARPSVPVTLDVNRAADGVLAGSAQLEPFQIQYLRRVVHVEQLRVLLDAKDSADFPVDGRFVVAQTQYKVFIDVSGTLRNPLLSFSSDPYLPKNEIISVLLYDRTSSELVSADAETAGSFEAAIADRAIGLFGLWAFASTPIRSFSYNPVTKVYSATVQLADGVTGEVGTNWEEAAHLEVRKRVSKRWVLTASWTPSATEHDQAPRLTLQWEKRF